MTQHRGLFVALDGSNLGTLPVDARLALSGLIATSGTTGIAIQQGVFYDGKGSVVSGTAATGTMTYSIRTCVIALNLLGTVASGPVIAANDGAITVNTTAAPGANSRWDVIWVRQTATATDGGADATNTFIVGCTQGTAAASPTVPAIPTGAYALAQALMTTGTTHTDTLAITQTHGWTVAQGGPIPVRNTTERTALTPYAGMDVFRIDLGTHETFNALAGGFLRDAAQLPLQDLTHQPRRLLSRLSTISLPDNTTTAVNAWSVDTGDDGAGSGIIISSSTATFTSGGLYRVDFSMEFAAAATGLRRIAILKNGTMAAQMDGPGSAASLMTLSLSRVLALAPSDTLQPTAYQNSGSAMTAGSTLSGIVVWNIVRLDDL